MASWKDDAKERVKTQKEGASFKLNEGPNLFRIMPNKKGPKFSPFIEFRIHRDVGPDKRFVGCGKDISGEGKCWLCDKKIPELENSESSAMRLKAEKLAAKEQFVVQVSRINDDGKWTMPKFWWVSTGNGLPGRHSRSLSIQVQSLLASSRVDYEDPIKGRNMSIERHGSGLQTKYDPIITDEVSSKVPQAVLAKLEPLEDVVPEYSAKRQYNAYMGREDDAETEPVSRPRHSRPTASVEAEEPTEEVEETTEGEYGETTDEEQDSVLVRLDDEVEAEATDEDPAYEDEPDPDAPEDDMPEDDAPAEEVEEPPATPPRRTPAPAKKTAPVKKHAPAPAAKTGKQALKGKPKPTSHRPVDDDDVPF